MMNNCGGRVAGGRCGEGRGVAGGRCRQADKTRRMRHQTFFFFCPQDIRRRERRDEGKGRWKEREREVEGRERERWEKAREGWGLRAKLWK